MDENLFDGFSPVSLPVTTVELSRELSSVIDEKSDEEVNIIPATSIKVVSFDEILQVGQSIKLNIESTPINANNPIVIWESSDPSVAIVTSDGIVVAKKIGEVDITATSSENEKITNTISISVTNTGEEEGGEVITESTSILAESGENIITEDDNLLLTEGK